MEHGSLICKDKDWVPSPETVPGYHELNLKLIDIFIRLSEWKIQGLTGSALNAEMKPLENGIK